MLDLDVFATISARNALHNNTDDLSLSSIMSIALARDSVADALANEHPTQSGLSSLIKENTKAIITNGDTSGFTDELDALLELLDSEDYINDLNYCVLLASVGSFLTRDGSDKESRDFFGNLLNNYDGEITGLQRIELVASTLWFTDYHGFRQLAVDKLTEWSAIDANVKLIKEFTRTFMDRFPDVDDMGYEARLWAEAYTHVEPYGQIEAEMRRGFFAICDAFPDLVYRINGVISVDFYMQEFETTLADYPDTFRNLFLDMIEEQVFAQRSLLEWSTSVTNNNSIYSIADCSWSEIGERVKKILGVDELPKVTSEKVDTAQSSTINHTTGNKTSKDSSSGGCYVATAVYGSYDCPEVWVLRRYRDHRLAKSLCGRLFIRAYYTVSPTFIHWFGQKTWFDSLLHPILDNFVARLRMKGYAATPYIDD